VEHIVHPDGAGHAGLRQVGNADRVPGADEPLQAFGVLVHDGIGQIPLQPLQQFRQARVDISGSRQSKGRPIGLLSGHGDETGEKTCRDRTDQTRRNMEGHAHEEAAQERGS
jgi:hypothetical protein